MKMRNALPLSVTLGAAVLLAGCAAVAPPTSPGAGETNPHAVTSESPASMAADNQAPVVAEELNFTATDVSSGASVDGTSLAGKDTILWFWASWCPTCQSEASAVAEAAAQLPDGVTLVGIPGRSDVAASQDFIDTYGLGTFSHWYDDDGSIWSAFGVPTQPAFALVNDDGTVQTIPGALGTAGILDAAQKLLDS